MSVVSSVSVKSAKGATNSKSKPEESVAKKVKLLVWKRGQSMAKVASTKKAVNTAGNDLTTTQVLEFQHQLDNYYAEWHSYHDQILDLVDDEEVQNHMEDCNVFEDQYALVLIALETVSLAQTQQERVVHKQQPLKVPVSSIDAYLTAQCNVLKRCGAASESSKSEQPEPAGEPKTTAYKSHVTMTAEKASARCEFCAGEHINCGCPDFAKLLNNQRTEKVQSHRLYFNCMQKGHSAKECRSKNSCRKCEKRHHTLLHFESAQPARSSHVQSESKPEESKPNEIPEPESVVVEKTASGSSAMSCVGNQLRDDSMVILMTAIGQVVDSSGAKHQCRTLLDCASQVGTIRAGLASELDQPARSVNTVVGGVNGKRSNITNEVSVPLHSLCGDFRATVDCLVMEKLTSNLPTVLEDVSSWELPSGIQLVDPSFYVPGEVDILLGAKHFWSAMKNGKRKRGVGFPELRETNFGWVIVGARSKVFPAVQTLSCNVLFLDGPTSAVQQIKEVEQVSGGPPLPTEEESSEEFNQRSHKRDATGGHGVGLPFKSVVESGESEFLLETEQLGHCELVDKNKDKPGTKVRVVFGTFAESSSGASLTGTWIVDNIHRKDSRVVSDHLVAGEFWRSLKALVRSAQHTSTIGNDINREERHEPCKQVQSLNLFIEDGVNRVGGRRQISRLSYETKQPKIIPHKHSIVTSSSRAFNAGPSRLFAAVRQRFWPINGRSTVREVTRKSMTCFRSKPSEDEPVALRHNTSRRRNHSRKPRHFWSRWPTENFTQHQIERSGPPHNGRSLARERDS